MTPLPVKLLIVEDHPDLREFLQITLTQLGHFSVTCAPDGITGLEQTVSKKS